MLEEPTINLYIYLKCNATSGWSVIQPDVLWAPKISGYLWLDQKKKSMNYLMLLSYYFWFLSSVCWIITMLKPKQCMNDLIDNTFKLGSRRFISAHSNSSLMNLFLQEIERVLPSAPPPDPKHQLRRTSSAPLWRLHCKWVPTKFSCTHIVLICNIFIWH